ncbi:ferrous iron transport protein B [Candidatus Soleaferrea massiliensis]|uniref:ferrous iron transport protein B n=1 Tax=Candidatus Soleaferrea massiliensis TaxID=1470354 RepID=UPI00058E8186|nr:ferrous iron transport protein B [Candidatus Soleaferrea massiliensis]
MSKLFALIGNQNCGKTTLFNRLTGSNQHVGNFPGVTVEKKEGAIRKQKDCVVVDLPGIYSLSPYTSEEIVTRDFLIKDKPDAVINIVDATNIERNLYLTLQLMELDIPVIIALNMMDEVRQSGNSIDVLQLEEELTIPIVPISASKNEGVDELIERAVKVAQKHQKPKRLDFCTGEVHKAIHSVMHLIEDKARNIGYTPRFAATKLIDDDEFIIDLLKLDEDEMDTIEHIITQMEKNLKTDRQAALADMRYNYIEKICSKAVEKKNVLKEKARSEKIDRILTSKVLAIPIFLCIMFLIFWLTFGLIGPVLSDLLTLGIDAAVGGLSTLLTDMGVSYWMYSLVIDGICTGVGSVLSFLPTITLLFFFLSMLEDSGYMARVAFVMDKLLRKIGLSGRSFVPMLIGFGCSVPAIMATRTLASERDRKMTIILTPFMSCSAKLPIYSIFTAAFFPKNAAVVMITLYVLGIVVAILAGLLLKKTVFRGNPIPFVMELPAYRLPTFKNTMLHMWDKAKDFIRKAFTVIFIAAIVIWFLQSFNWQFNWVEDSSQSILASIGSYIAPLFAPLGFGDWRASTALITGLTAKETVVSTFAVLFGTNSNLALQGALQSVFSPLSAFAFLCFTLLYMPCVAAFATSRRELGSTSTSLLTAAFQTGVAWVVALIVFQAGTLLGF